MRNFQHPIVARLYEIDCFIEEEALKEILSLGEAVVPDLELILRSFIDDPDLLEEQDGWEFAHLHAFFLLAELRSERSLPLILEFLAQDEDFLESALSDMLSQDLWEVVCKCGVNSLDDLEQFVLNPAHYEYARTTVLSALAQIGLHCPEKRDEVVDVFRHVFFYYSDGKIGAPRPGQDAFDHRLDTESLSWAIFDASCLGATELTEDVRSAFEEDLVDRWMVDDPAEFGKAEERKFTTIFEKYDSMRRYYAFAKESPHNPERRKAEFSTKPALEDLSQPPDVSVCISYRPSLDRRESRTIPEVESSSVRRLVPQHAGDPMSIDFGQTLDLATRGGKPLTVRRLALADAEALQTFNDELSDESREMFLPHLYDDETVGKILARSEAGEDLTLGVFDGERIVGYFFLWYANERVPLLGIGLLDEFHRQGLGQQMMGILIDEARESGREGIELTTMQHNDAAFALYQKMGFNYLKDVENLVGDGRIVVERAMFYEIKPGAQPMQGPHRPPV